GSGAHYIIFFSGACQLSSPVSDWSFLPRCRPGIIRRRNRRQVDRAIEPYDNGGPFTAVPAPHPIGVPLVGHVVGVLTAGTGSREGDNHRVFLCLVLYTYLVELLSLIVLTRC